MNHLMNLGNLENMPISEERLQQLRQATKKQVLQKLRNKVANGWPEGKSQVEPEICPYWKIKKQISANGDLLLRQDRVIVPISLRKEVLSQIHSSHLGIKKCKRRTRDVLFWPGMNDQITNIVSKCNTCNTYRIRKQENQ